MTGIITGIHRCALDDGPGVRTAVFLKGCALCCGWCHNPETQLMRSELMIYPQRCVGCGACESACPLLLRNRNGAQKPAPHSKLCTGCGECSAVCPSQALITSGKSVSIGEVMEIVRRDAPFYEDTGGGMTLTGGDPLMQADFSLELLTEAARLGIHTCVETSGAGPVGALNKLMPQVDLWLFDIKGTPEIYEKHTGTSFAPILSGLIFLLENKRRVTLRCPIIPGVHNNDEYYGYLEAFRRRMDMIFPLEDMQLLPYHTYGTDKYAALGRMPNNYHSDI